MGLSIDMAQVQANHWCVCVYVFAFPDQIIGRSTNTSKTTTKKRVRKLIQC